MEFFISQNDFVSCGLYKLVPEFHLVCANEECEENIQFDFWNQDIVQKYDCDVCGSTMWFEPNLRIEFFLDLTST